MQRWANNALAIAGLRVSMPKPFLLMTRPPADSERFIDSLDAVIRKKIAVLISPLFEIVAIDVSVELTEYAGAIFTSANAVAMTEPHTGMPAYCVGAQTTSRARHLGWDALFCGENAEKFISNVAEQGPPGPLLHLSGTHQRGDIAQRLTQLGIATEAKVIYDQQLKGLSDQAREVLGGEVPVFVPLFSPRTSLQFASELSQRSNSEKNQLVAFALSRAVADPLAQLGIGEVIVALRPTVKDMRKAVENRIVKASLA